jgi:hypothetical protein
MFVSLSKFLFTILFSFDEIPLSQPSEEVKSSAKRKQQGIFFAQIQLAS